MTTNAHGDDSGVAPVSAQGEHIDTVATAEGEDVVAAPPAFEQGAAAPGMTSVPKFSGKKVSVAWSHFSKPFLNKLGLLLTTCMHCKDPLRCGSRDCGTSSLLGHFASCKHNPANQKSSSLQPLLTFTNHKGKEGLSSWKFDQKACRDSLARMIVADEQPFRYVESKGYRQHMATCCPQFRIPSRTTITRDVLDLFVLEKTKFKEYMLTKSPRISLTTDTWNSNQQINYMCITAHYVDDDWILNKKIINFCPINSHKGEDIGKAIEHCLTDWGLDKIMCVTVDNASSNEPAIAHLRKKLNIFGTNVLSGKFMHMRCAAHIINLIVSDGIALLGRSVEKIRVAVRYVKQSPSWVARFKACVVAAGIDSKTLLCLDVPTRWNSTYLMLKSACNLEAAFDRYDCEDPLLRHELETRKFRGDNVPLGMISDDDWSSVKSFMKLLKHFYDLTCRVSGSSYVTCNTYLDEIGDTFQVIQKGQMDEHDFNIVNMAKKMQEKFDKYWADVEKVNLLIFIASVFDPRNKLLVVNYVVETMYASNIACTLIENIKTVLHDVTLYGVEVGTSANVALASTYVGVVNVLPPRAVMRVACKKARLSQVGGIKSELDKYLHEDVESDDVNFHILEWWKCNSPRFPILSRMCIDILGIPISTVSSESAFSTGGRVVSDFRSSLSPKVVEALICTQDWISDEIESINHEEELQELNNIEEDLNELTL